MSNWIKLEKCTVDKPEVIKIAAKLSISQEAVIGHCIRFWSWCDDHQKNGVTILEDTAQVDAIARMEGFGMAMVDVGWLSLVDSTIRIPNFDRHLGNSAKNRAMSAKRMAKTRSVNGKRQSNL